MRKICRFIAVMILAVLGLTACGGGGGGGASANGDFQLSATSMQFSGTVGQSYILPQMLMMNSIGSGAHYIGAGTPDGRSLPSWLSVSSLSSGNGFLVSVSAWGLPAGTQSTVLRVGTGDQNGNLMSYKDVPIAFTLTGVGSTPTRIPGTSPTPTTAPSATLVPTPSASPSSIATPVPQLNLSATSVTLGGANGREHAAAQPLSISTNVYGVYGWSVQSKPDWLQLSKPLGTLTQAADSFSLSADLSKLAVGSQSGDLVLQAVVNGSTLSKTVAVKANLDQRKLIASETGIALSKTPSWSRLSSSVTVRDNFGTGSWTATSDQSWLKVTASGNSGESLTVTADPTGLSQDVIRTAKVTIASNSGAASETVVVGLWNGSSTPSSVVSVSGAYKYVVADPVRPLAYANNGGSAITIFNVYSGSSVGTIDVTGATLGHMEISPDGKRLYAINSSVQIKEIDLTQSNPVVLGSWAVPLEKTPAVELKYVRPNGEGVVFAAGVDSSYSATPFTPFRARDGVVLAATGNLYLSPGLAVAPDQSNLLTAHLRYPIAYSAVNQVFEMASAISLATGCNGATHDVAVMRNGSFAIAGCVSSGTGYGFPRASLDTASISQGYYAGDAYPNNAEVASDGKVLLGSYSGNLYVADVWVYRSDNTLLTSFWLGGNLQNAQLKVSGDSMVGIALVGAGENAPYGTPYIKFLPIGPDSSASGKSRSGKVFSIRSVIKGR